MSQKCYESGDRKYTFDLGSGVTILLPLKFHNGGGEGVSSFYVGRGQKGPWELVQVSPHHRNSEIRGEGGQKKNVRGISKVEGGKKGPRTLVLTSRRFCDCGGLVSSRDFQNDELWADRGPQASIVEILKL